MAGNLSFAIAINFLTENFKKGASQVKAGFRAMQMQVLTFAAALGAGGLGLTNFVSRLIDVARETNRVSTALKNVSGSMGQFANNQRYLLNIAKKYGLEINALTGNFAKFTAAASISGMSMMEQRKIFESVSRACTAFGMSADDSNGVFLALSQMMSKGKISSEELRLQMGERLPVAIQAMAKAAGVSVGQLDKLLKQGKLLSADVLPKFGKALDELIPNVDTDNLETSMNRLKNVFTEFTNGLDVQGKYKALIDGLASGVEFIKNKISGLVAFVITIAGGKLIQTIYKYFKQFSDNIDVIIHKSKVAEEQKLLFAEKRIAAEKTYEATLTAYNTTENGKRLASKSQLTKAEKAMDAARLIEKKMILAADTAAEKAAAVSSTTVWGRASKTIAAGFLQLGRTIKGAFMTMWPMIFLTVIGKVIAGLVNIRKEAKRIKNIFSDYQKSMSVAGNTQEVTRMETLLKIMNDRKKSQKEINAAQTELQGMLGKEKLSQEELNKRILKRISLLKEAAMADAAFNTVGEFTEKNAKLGVGLDLSPEQMERLARLNPGKNQGYDNKKYYYDAIRKEAGQLSKGGRYVLDESKLRQIDKAVDEYVQNLRVINDATARAGEHQANTGGITPPLEPDDDKKKTPLQKQQESYDKQLSELKAELEIGSKTQAEYNKALGELNIKMFAQAKGTNDKKVLESDYYKNLKIAAEKAVQNQDKNAALVELEKVQKDYNAKVEENQAQFAKGIISQKELNGNIASLSVEAAKSAASIKNIGNEADIFITAMQINAKLLATPIKVKPRDTTFDYKKTKVDIASENLNKAKEYADKLKEHAREIGQTLSDELANAMANVTTLEEALKIAQVNQDVKDFTKELNEGLYSGVKDIASSSDRVVSAFQNLSDVMSNVDASGWEKIMAIWNTMTNVVDSFLSIIKLVENLTEITDKLAGAKQKEIALDKQATSEKVVNAATGMAADTAAAATKKVTATQEVSANTAAAASEAGKSAAKLPFPWNIVAIGGAIAAAIAAFAVIPKFATGGIYMGGTTSGDKGLARLNKGEMVLNMSQQSQLFKSINSGELGGGGRIISSVATTKLKGKDMILIINNELKSQGKKPIS